VKRKEGEKRKGFQIWTSGLSGWKSPIAAHRFFAFPNVDIKESSVTARTAAEGSRRVYYLIMVVESRL
jgi:hypothetical protein